MRARQKTDYIKKIIELLDEPERKRILAEKITYQGRTIFLKDVLNNPTTEDADMYLMLDVRPLVYSNILAAINPNTKFSNNISGKCPYLTTAGM